MNKRFSTLLAAALVAGGLSSTVMAADTTPDKDKYYRLEDGSSNVLGVDALKTDSLVLAAKGTSLDDRFFWTITKENTATATDVYKLVNKETKAVLSLAIPGRTTETGKTGNVAAALIKANGVLNQWVNSSAAAWGSAGKFTAYKDGKEYGLVTVKNLWGGAVTSAVVAVAQLNGSGATVAAETGATVLQLKLVDDNDPVDLTAKDLNAKKNAKGFDLTFTPNSDDNIFSGKTLQALSVTGTSVSYARDNDNNEKTANLTIAATSADIAFDGTDATNKIVFLATGKTVTNGAKQTVKYFAVVDTAYIAGTTQFAFTEDTIGISADGMSLVPAEGRDLASYMFSVSYNYSKGNVDIYPLAVPTAPATDQYWGDVEKKGTYAADITSESDALVVTNATNGYLAFINVLKDAKALTLGEKATVEALEAYKNMSITFGSSTAVKNLDTKVAYFVKEMDEDNKATGNYWVAGDAKSAAASAYVPSTQWNLVSNGGTSYKLVNRESGKELSGANGTAYDVDAANGVYMIGSKTVTLVKCPEATGNYVGYKKFSASQVDNLTFAIQVQALSNDPVYLTTKDSAIVATVDADKKVMFRLKPNKEMKFGDAENDSLKRTSYMLLSADKKSYLAYDKALKSYKMTSVAWENANATDATAVLATSKTDTAFVYFQAVGKDKYSLVMEKIYTPTAKVTAGSGITIDGAYGTKFTIAQNTEAGVRTQSGLYDQKVSVNITDGAVSQTEYDNVASNTVFMIEDGTPDYDKTIQKPTHQTITLSTDNAMALTITSDNFAALKRVGQELKADYTIDNLKMYIDTATMADVNKPLYYIATGQNISDDCKAKGEMNYLVSFEDSVKIDGYTSETLPRVGFLEGVVEADTITLFNGHAIADKDTVVIKKNHVNIANWAFTANENGSISLENQKSNKFVAVRNDVLVMVPSINEAAQFNMAATEAPTANEGVEVSEVAVIAGEGQVTIANAAGKKVVVSNILGQVVANTVLTSDNAVIAAPQGVVVVAVEGEEAVKAIVK